MITDNADFINEVNFVVQTMRWPRWPILPMKRYVESGSWPTAGLILDGGDTHIINDSSALTVFECSIFSLAELAEKAKKELGVKTVTWMQVLAKVEKRHRYESVRAMVEAGWRVD